MSSPDIEKGGAFQPASPTSHNSQPLHEGTDAKHDSCSIISETSLSPVEEEKSPKEPFPAYERETDYETPVVVHRSKRRGLFGQLTLLAEVENPKTFPRRAKWFITFITAVSGAAAPMGSSIFFRRYTLFRCCCASRSNLFFDQLPSLKCPRTCIPHPPSRTCQLLCTCLVCLFSHCGGRLSAKSLDDGQYTSFPSVFLWSSTYSAQCPIQLQCSS